MTNSFFKERMIGKLLQFQTKFKCEKIPLFNTHTLMRLKKFWTEPINWFTRNEGSFINNVMGEKVNEYLRQSGINHKAGWQSA